MTTESVPDPLAVQKTTEMSEAAERSIDFADRTQQPR
jgi:hypothetical protein